MTSSTQLDPSSSRGGSAPESLRSRLGLSGTWTRIATRSYGTAIYRVEGRHAFYVKTAPPQDADDMRFHAPSEADRLAWLGARGFPVPEVVAVGTDADLMWLATTAVDGRLAAARWSQDERRVVLDLVADVARALHTLPAADCPFDRTLPVSLAWARTAANTGKVDLDDLDDRHSGWTAEQLLAQLDQTPVPAEDDVVVCHGDLCLDNIVIAPDTMTLAGVLDVGRLGTADRWRDLSIMVRNLSDECGEWSDDSDRVTRLLDRYGLDSIDERKAHFYWLLDEFF